MSDADPAEDRRQEGEYRAVMGTRTHAREHLDPQCPHYPANPRPVTEADRRTALHTCQWCKWESPRDEHPRVGVFGYV